MGSQQYHLLIIIVFFISAVTAVHARVSPSMAPVSPNVVDHGGWWDTKDTLVVISVFVVVFIVGLVVGFCLHRKKHTSHVTPHATPSSSNGDSDHIKIIIDGDGGLNQTSTQSKHVDNLVIPIHVLRTVTDDFSQDNIIGRGGFGRVYKAELHDGTKIAVKRMNTMTKSDDEEFKSEIAVLTKVRHRNLVALSGYCLDGNERLLVYEYMPQGTLSRFLHDWRKHNLNPLGWTQRLIIALDVARGVEYMHGQSFVHRDLKSSNILLSDDMRAKVADFGLARSNPDGENPLFTRLAGSFGYLAPEYAAMGQVTTKIDVFSFGVILMELITGRTALSQEGRVPLVQWFRKLQLHATLQEAIDPTLNLDKEALASMSKVVELASHCCAYEPHERPQMSHAVNVLYPLAELWKPGEDETPKVDLDIILPEVVKMWQALVSRSPSFSESVEHNFV